MHTFTLYMFNTHSPSEWLFLSVSFLYLSLFLFVHLSLAHTHIYSFSLSLFLLSYTHIPIHNFCSLDGQYTHLLNTVSHSQSHKHTRTHTNTQFKYNTTKQYIVKRLNTYSRSVNPEQKKSVFYFVKIEFEKQCFDFKLYETVTHTHILTNTHTHTYTYTHNRSTLQTNRSHLNKSVKTRQKNLRD
jgi:hypothetical protein